MMRSVGALGGLTPGLRHETIDERDNVIMAQRQMRQQSYEQTNGQPHHGAGDPAPSQDESMVAEIEEEFVDLTATVEPEKSTKSLSKN